MPIIEYEDEERAVLGEVYLPAGELPSIGDLFEVEGRMVRRLPPTLAGAGVEPDQGHVSHVNPPWWGAHRAAGGKFTPDGRAIFQSKAQIEKTAKVARDRGEQVAYNGFRSL